MAIRYKADYRSLGFTAFWYVLLIAAWFTPFKWYFVLPFSIALCLFSFFCSVIIHNTIHVPVFDKKWQNKLNQFLLTFVHGHPVSGFVPGHNLSHHKHLNTNMDAARTQRARFSYNFFNQFLFFFLMVKDVATAEQQFVKKMKKEKPKWWRQYWTEFAVLMTIKIGLTVVAPVKAILFLWLPHFYAVWGIFGTNFWQHDGCDHEHPYNHSRNFTGKILNFWIFNNGFHGPHHEKPNMHWSLYPEYYEKEFKPHMHPNLDQPSFLSYLWKTFVYPAKRIDYLGNPLVLPPKEETGDWVNDTSKSQFDNEFGAVQQKEATKREPAAV